jgi:RNA polymerase sigma factor (sigma-70 family)
LVAVPSVGRADQSLGSNAPADADAHRLYEQYARQIQAYCFHQLGNREEAEDATQSTFLNAFRGLQRGVTPEFEMAWLYKIAHNVCLTRQRSTSRRRKVETPGDLDALQDVIPARQVDSDELIGLPEALNGMPKQQQRALLLREWQGLSYREIADELGITQAAVETLLFRARRALAAGLEEEPKKKSLAQRVMNGGDAGSWLTLIKSLLVTGGSKVAATVATVAATSVVAATPVARHAVEQVVTFSSADTHRPAAQIQHTPAQAAHTHTGASVVPGGTVPVHIRTAVPKHAKHHAGRIEKTFTPGDVTGAHLRGAVTGNDPGAAVAPTTPGATPAGAPVAPPPPDTPTPTPTPTAATPAAPTAPPTTPTGGDGNTGTSSGTSGNGGTSGTTGDTGKTNTGKTDGSSGTSGNSGKGGGSATTGTTGQTSGSGTTGTSGQTSSGSGTGSGSGSVSTSHGSGAIAITPIDPTTTIPTTTTAQTPTTPAAPPTTTATQTPPPAPPTDTTPTTTTPTVVVGVPHHH